MNLLSFFTNRTSIAIRHTVNFFYKSSQFLEAAHEILLCVSALRYILRRVLSVSSEP